MKYYVEAMVEEIKMSLGMGVLTGLREERVDYVSKGDLAVAAAGALISEGHAAPSTTEPGHLLSQARLLEPHRRIPKAGHRASTNRISVRGVLGQFLDSNRWAETRAIITSFGRNEPPNCSLQRHELAPNKNVKR